MHTPKTLKHILFYKIDFDLELLNKNIRISQYFLLILLLKHSIIGACNVKIFNVLVSETHVGV